MDIKECVCALRDELLLHGDLYKAFFASIISVLEPREKYFPDDLSFKIETDTGAVSLTKEILDRIIG